MRSLVRLESKAGRCLRKLGPGWLARGNNNSHSYFIRLASNIQLIDLRGDFDTFVMLTKTGNPVPEEHSFIESTGSGARLTSSDKFSG